MTSPQFQKAYKLLNPEQKLAVDTIEGPVMVVAGPGTGKTQILTLRIANILLKTQVNPDNILALTFTESAASEMRERLVNLIGTPAYRVEINTFHGFCNDVIKNYPEDFPHLLSSDSITELEQIQILEELINTLPLKLLKPFGDPLYYTKRLLSEINNLKKEGVTPEQLKEVVKLQQKDFEKIGDLYHEKGKYGGEMKGKYADQKREMEKNEELEVMYKNYQKTLREKRMYDFNDMLLEVKTALEKNRSLLLILQERYQYILVDEHQDTNTAQNKIIELLGNFFDEPNIFVVGDEKQAIFRFQGASLENFLFFKTLYPNAKLISLVENYRSHQKILDAADSLISKNFFSNLITEKKSLKSQGRIKDEPIKFLAFEDFFAEYEYIAEDIYKRIKKGLIPSEIAVIGRNNKDLQIMAEVLERKGVAYAINSDLNVLSDPYIQKLLILLQAIEHVGLEIDLLKVMHVDTFDIEPMDIYKLVEYSRREEISVYDFLAKLNAKVSKKVGLENWQNIRIFYQKLNNLQKQNRNDGFEHLFVSAINESDLRAQILKSPKRYEVLDKLISLFEETKILVSRDPDFNLANFLHYLELCKKHNVSLRAKVQTVNKEAVNLMTAHRSKGLEFENVYVINVFDGHWGNPKRKRGGFKIAWDKLGIKLNVEAEENEDERRLFYVALTRAKKDIYISFSKRSMEGREQVMSQFVGEIEPRLLEKVDIAKFEEDFYKNKDKILSVKPETKISAKQKEFLNKLFLKRGLSATALDNYLRCPWSYFYKNLLLFPGVRSNSEIFGTAIHKALDTFIKLSWRGDVSFKTLMDSFAEVIKRQPLSKIERKTMMEKGEKTLRGYLKEVLPKWAGRVAGEMVIRGVKLDERILLNGRLDMVEPISKFGEVIVHDFKTGKPKSRNAMSGLTESSDVNYLRQLTFYKILVENYHQGKMKMVAGVIDFVEPDDRNRYKSEVFEISEQEVKVLEDQIKLVAKEIINLEFWDRFCETPECEYCQLRRLALSD